MGPGFSVKTFLKLGGFAKSDRMLFYAGLKARCYVFSGKVYVRAASSFVRGGLTEKPNDNNSNNIKDSAQTHMGRCSRRPGLLTLDNDDVDKKLEPIVSARPQQTWERPNLSDRIRELLLTLTGDQAPNWCVLGTQCDINHVPCFVGARFVTCGEKTTGFLELSLSTPFRPFDSQRLFLCEDREVVHMLTVCEKLRTRRSVNFLTDVMSQNVREEVSVLGKRWAWGAVRSFESETAAAAGMKAKRRWLAPGASGFPAAGKCSVYRMYALLLVTPTDRTVNSADLGPCVLCISESVASVGTSSGVRSQVSWTYTIDRELRSYTANTSRVWKVMMYQKDSMREYELVLSDLDFRRLYPDFSRSEKALYEIFRPDIKQTREERVRCLELLGQKLSIQQTDVGSVMLVGLKQRPNPRGKSSVPSDLYYPLRESLRQKTILAEGEDGYFTQYATNGRQTVLLTTSKHFRKYLTVIVYYMIPFSISDPVLYRFVDSWKIKVRVASTGRQFMADIDGEIYGEMRRRIESRTTSPWGSSKNVRPEPSSPVYSSDRGVVSQASEDADTVPRKLAGKFVRDSSQSLIRDHYIRNAQVRENANLVNEPAVLAQRKQKVAVRCG